MREGDGEERGLRRRERGRISGDWAWAGACTRSRSCVRLVECEFSGARAAVRACICACLSRILYCIKARVALYARRIRDAEALWNVYAVRIIARAKTTAWDQTELKIWGETLQELRIVGVGVLARCEKGFCQNYQVFGRNWELRLRGKRGFVRLIFEDERSGWD